MNWCIIQSVIVHHQRIITTSGSKKPSHNNTHEQAGTRSVTNFMSHSVIQHMCCLTPKYLQKTMPYLVITRLFNTSRTL